MQARPGPAFEALSDAVLAIAAERSVESILQRLVEAAPSWSTRSTRRSGSAMARAASRGS